MSLSFSRNCLWLVIGIVSVLYPDASIAGTRAEPVTGKFGYFDLKVIRNTFPDSVAFEQARYTGENQLRASANSANEALKLFQNEKHSDTEIAKERDKLQTAVDSKTGSFVRQMLATNLNITEKIKHAATATAEVCGVDYVVDANSVFFGGGNILKNGIDVTADMMKILGTEPSE